VISIGNGQLVVFGGYGSYHGPLSAEEPGLLNDIQIFDMTASRWLSPHTLNAGFADLVETPRPRHSHLSIISSDCLFVVGGEESNNTWLDDIHVYDLTEHAWIQAWRFPRPSGTYLNVVACAEHYVHLSNDGLPGNIGSPQWTPSLISGRTSPASSLPSPLTIGSVTYLDNGADVSISSPPCHLPYSAEPSDEFPCDIYMYSNYNVCVIFCASFRRKLIVLLNQVYKCQA
jgi:leucine-zipper-like transcriptional regulator 1